MIRASKYVIIICIITHTVPWVWRKEEGDGRSEMLCLSEMARNVIESDIGPRWPPVAILWEKKVCIDLKWREIECGSKVNADCIRPGGVPLSCSTGHFTVSSGSPCGSGKYTNSSYTIFFGLIISPKFEISGILWFWSGRRLRRRHHRRRRHRRRRRTPRLVFHVTATPMRVSNS